MALKSRDELSVMSRGALERHAWDYQKCWESVTRHARLMEMVRRTYERELYALGTSQQKLRMMDEQCAIAGVQHLPESERVEAEAHIRGAYHAGAGFNYDGGEG